MALQNEGIEWRHVGFDFRNCTYGFDLSSDGECAILTVNSVPTVELPMPVWQALIAFMASTRRAPVQTKNGDLPMRAGKPWLVEEDARLVRAVRRGTSVELIAKDHDRTRGAIASRLVALGLVTNQQDIPIFYASMGIATVKSGSVV